MKHEKSPISERSPAGGPGPEFQPEPSDKQTDEQSGVKREKSPISERSPADGPGPECQPEPSDKQTGEQIGVKREKSPMKKEPPKKRTKWTQLPVFGPLNKGVTHSQVILLPPEVAPWGLTEAEHLEKWNAEKK